MIFALQHGIGLAELLISLCLSVLLITGLTEHYLIVKQQYQRSTAQLEQAFDVQLITGLIRDSVRKAGFTPCLGIDNLQTHPKLTALKMGLKNPDSVTISRMSEHFAGILRQTGNSQVLIASNVGNLGGAGRSAEEFAPKTTVLLANCEHAELQQVGYAQNTSEGMLLTFKAPLVFSYLSEGYVGKWIEETWSIEKNRQGQKAFFYNAKHREELSSSITGLSAEYNSHVDQSFLRVKLTLKNHDPPLMINTRVRVS